jgi:hypothetical protein
MGGGVRARCGRLARSAIVTVLCGASALAAGAGDAARAQDGDGETPPAAPAGGAARADSGAAAPADSAARTVNADSVAAAERAKTGGFHPMYVVKYNVEKDVRRFDQSLIADYALGEKIRFNAASAFGSKNETTLHRTGQVRRFNTSIEYRLKPGSSLGFDISTNRSLDSDKTLAVVNESKTKARNVGLFARYEATLLDSLRFNLDASGGTDWSEVREVTEDGTSGELALGFRYNPRRTLQSAFDWKGSRSTNDATSASGVIENRDLSQAMTGGVTFTPAHAVRMQLRFAAANAQFQYPTNDVNKSQETRIEDRNGFGLTTDLKKSEGLALKLDAAYDRTARDYTVDRPQTVVSDSVFEQTLKRERERTSDIAQTALKATLNYSAWKGGKTTLAMSRDWGDEEYPFPPSDTTDLTKRIDHGGVSLSHDQIFSSRLKGILSGKMDLLSYQFVKPAARASDRDLLTRSLDWTGEFRFTKRLMTTFGLGVKEDQTVNISSKRSGENNTKQSWFLTPRIRYEASKAIRISQSYEMRNDFTFFDQDKSRNFLSRMRKVDTQFTYRVLSGVTLDMTHMFQVREDGSFDRENDTFAKSTQTSKQSIEASTGYSPITGLRFSFGERVEANRAYVYQDVDGDGLVDKVKKSGSQGDNVRHQLILGLNFTWEITKRWNLKLNGRQTMTHGNPAEVVSEIEKRFYQADVGMEYRL